MGNFAYYSEFALSYRKTQAAAGADSGHVYGGNPVGLVAAGVCFAVILAAIGYGIYLIVSSA